MTRPGSTLCLLALPCLVAVHPAWAGDAPPPEDPWRGTARAAIVKLLGEPDKAKPMRDGGESLAYTFYRIAPDAPPHPQALLVSVPGVGVVARVVKSPAADLVTIEPPIYDEQGRPVSGERTPTDSAYSSYDVGTGKLSRSTSRDGNPPVVGKVKVRFVLDPGGRVVDWSVSGKKK